MRVPRIPLIRRAPAVLGTLLLLALPLGVTGAQATERRVAPLANEFGRIPVLEYHLIGDRENRWSRSWQRFGRDLELLHSRGYRPITVKQLVRGDIDVPPGTSPVVITFDDASPGQFRYVEGTNGELTIDSTSAVGVWNAFAATHPEWKGRAVFCALPAATEGHAFFGDKGIQGQKTAWRLHKVRWLIENGFELCNHTLWHANFSKMGDTLVQEQIARAQLAVDSAKAGYSMTTLALPLGIWPADRGLLSKGGWRDQKSGRVIRYNIDAILMVAGGAARSPFDSLFNPLKIPRVQVFENELETLLDKLDRDGNRYIAGEGRPVLTRK